MKALILGAGYGTRLAKGLDELDQSSKRKYDPLLRGKPKPLVPIAGKPLIEYLLEKIQQETAIRDVYVITNDHFYPQFKVWQASYDTSLSIKILNDGTTSNEDRLGVIGDLEYVVRTSKIHDDLLVLAGDTLFNMDFGDLVRCFQQKKKDIISVYREDPAVLHRRGVVVTDADGRVVQFLEKPKSPPTNLAAPIAYVLMKETLPLLSEIVSTDYSREMNLIEWIIGNNRREVHTFHFSKRYDVGVVEDYIVAEHDFSERLR